MAVEWGVVSAPAMRWRGDRSGSRFPRVGGASYMGAGQPAKQSHPRGTSVCLPTTLPLFEHQHPHTSTTRALETDRDMKLAGSNGLSYICTVQAGLDMPPEPSTSGSLFMSHFHNTSTRRSFKDMSEPLYQTFTPDASTYVQLSTPISSSPNLQISIRGQAYSTGRTMVRLFFDKLPTIG
jgi:hypothetical protein